MVLYVICMVCHRNGDIRIIRPLCLIRERLTRQYAKGDTFARVYSITVVNTNNAPCKLIAAQLPVINENCPACYEAPKVIIDTL